MADPDFGKLDFAAALFKKRKADEADIVSKSSINGPKSDQKRPKTGSEKKGGAVKQHGGKQAAQQHNKQKQPQAQHKPTQVQEERPNSQVAKHEHGVAVGGIKKKKKDKHKNKQPGQHIGEHPPAEQHQQKHHPGSSGKPVAGAQKSEQKSLVKDSFKPRDQPASQKQQQQQQQQQQQGSNRGGQAGTSKPDGGHGGKRAPGQQGKDQYPGAVDSVKGLWKFQTDYNDHFETSLEALQHLEPVLLQLCKLLGKDRKTLAIYDPYYCRGTIRSLYRQLGFTNFIHDNRDFYKDIRQGTVPAFDVLVTNPPYSEDHKRRILSYCVASRKPWALLMPNYVANKQYYMQEVAGEGTPLAGQVPSPFYLTPRTTKYTYTHPEGTGKDNSPFDSMWFVSGARVHDQLLAGCRKLQQQQGSSGGGGGGGGGGGQQQRRPWGVDLLGAVSELRNAQKVPTGKRLNPKQRAKLKAKMAAAHGSR